MARIDFFTGIGFMILSSFVYYLSLGMTKVRFGIGPGDYPRVIAVGLFFLGALLAVQSWLNKEPAKPIYVPGALKRVFILVVLTFVYLQLLPYLGFPWVTPFFLAAAMYHFGVRKYLTVACTSIGVTLALYYIFDGIFRVILPKFTLF